MLFYLLVHLQTDSGVSDLIVEAKFMIHLTKHLSSHISSHVQLGVTGSIALLYQLGTAELDLDSHSIMRGPNALKLFCEQLDKIYQPLNRQMTMGGQATGLVKFFQQMVTMVDSKCIHREAVAAIRRSHTN